MGSREKEEGNRFSERGKKAGVCQSKVPGYSGWRVPCCIPLTWKPVCSAFRAHHRLANCTQCLCHLLLCRQFNSRQVKSSQAKSTHLWWVELGSELAQALVSGGVVRKEGSLVLSVLLCVFLRQGRRDIARWKGK